MSVNYNDNSGQNSSFGGSLLTANSTPAFTDAAIASWSYLSEAMLFVVEINDELKAVLNVDVSDFADLAVGSAKAPACGTRIGDFRHRLYQGKRRPFVLYPEGRGRVAAINHGHAGTWCPIPGLQILPNPPALP